MTDKKEVRITNKSTGKTSVGYQAVKLRQEKPSNPNPISEVIGQVATASENGAEQEGGKGSKGKKAKRQIENFAQFIEYAYGRHGQFLVCPPALAKQITAGPSPTEEQRRNLIKLSESDRSFSVPRQLLLTSRELSDQPSLRTELRQFVRDLMLAHSYFVRTGMEPVIANLPDSLSISEALLKLSTGRQELLAGSPHGALKPSEFVTFRKNVVACLLLWAVETRQFSIQAVCDSLYSGVLEVEASGLTNDAERLRVLTDSQDFGALAIISAELRRRVEDSVRSTQQARHEAELARGAAAAAESELEAVKSALATSEARANGLQSDLERERATSRTELLHAKDDMESLRTRVMRRIKGDLALLEEGLVALRREPPKVGVMVDHAERVVEALRSEVRRLEGEK